MKTETEITMNDLRTQGEWEVRCDLNVESSINGRFICSCGLNNTKEGTLEENKANASFIVKACNNYDNVLENLKRIIDRIEENNSQHVFPSAYNRAKEAIKKAEA